MTNDRFSTSQPDFIGQPTRCLLIGLLSSGIGLGIGLHPFAALAQVRSPSVQLAQTPTSNAVFYVDPARGQDSPSAGSANAPYRTITYAFRQAKAGNTVRLAAGTYSQQTGETFPLLVPDGVILLGDESTRGQTVVITGSGYRISPTFAGQNMTMWTGKDSQIRGITVTNTVVRGTGIWVESTNPVIANCTFINSNREGIFITGTANPQVSNNVFATNGGNGISIASNATGQIQDNIFQNTGFGLAIGENSAPLVARNVILQNVDGVYINNSARPIFRNNLIANNQRDGIVATGSSKPDLGATGNPGNNIFRNNGQYDLNNGSSNLFVSINNTVDAKKTAGQVSLSGVADPNGVPTGGIFTDAVGHWAQAYIEALAKRGVISGFPDGNFRPDDPVTRVQYASIISRAFSPSAVRPSITFSDVNASFWGYPFIQTAVRGGFMSGYPEGVFLPNQEISRLQIYVALASGLNYGNGDPAILGRYQDAATIPTWARGYLSAITQRKVVVNYPNLAILNPNRSATRAEVAASVYQALVNAGKADPIPSAYVVVP